MNNSPKEKYTPQKLQKVAFLILLWLLLSTRYVTAQNKHYPKEIAVQGSVSSDLAGIGGEFGVSFSLNEKLFLSADASYIQKKHSTADFKVENINLALSASYRAYSYRSFFINPKVSYIPVSMMVGENFTPDEGTKLNTFTPLAFKAGVELESHLSYRLSLIFYGGQMWQKQSSENWLTSPQVSVGCRLYINAIEAKKNNKYQAPGYSKTRKKR